MTILDIIKNAMQIINVVAINEEPHAPDVTMALQVLNMMLDQWSLESLMVYYKVNETFDLTTGVGTYTIGTGALPTTSTNFNTSRPVKITHAFVRDLTNATQPIDFPISIVNNDEYQEILLKTLQSTYPRFLNYVPMMDAIDSETNAPGGQINLWPVPIGPSLKLGLSQTKIFSNYTDVATHIVLPPGYNSALSYNLAVELAPRFHFDLSPIISGKAIDTKARIKQNNSESVLAKIDYPSSTNSTRGNFNIFAGM